MTRETRKPRKPVRKAREFRIGDTVLVKPERQRAKIQQFYSDIPGGVLLDRKIGLFRSWNVADLSLVIPRIRKRK